MARLDRTLLGFGSAGESKKLFHGFSAAAGAVLHRCQDFARFRVLERFVQDVHAHDDGAENIVEVVGNAAGERADAFQPLSAEILGFQALFLGDVIARNQNGLGFSTGVQQHAPTAVQIALLAFGGAQS